MRTLARIRAALLALALVTPAARAQVALDAHGRVTDASTGAPLADAIVRIGDAGEWTTRSDREGRWRVRQLLAGRYVLRVAAIGYTPRVTTIDVNAAGGQAFDVGLTPVAARLDQVVVTAARREQRLKDVVVTTEVVSRREIEQTGATDLAAVLTEQTGIQLQGGHPTGAGVMLQGIGSERVLVLLDGQPLVGRLSGNFDLARVPTSIIERVEVVKGPQSTLYGSEAMGGVINVVTRRIPDAAWTGEARLLAGTQGRLDGQLHGTLSRGALGMSADIGRRAVERAPGVASSAGAMAERLDAAARVRWAAGEAVDLEGAVLALDERQRWRSGTLYSFADNVQVSARAGASVVSGASRLAAGMHVSLFDHLARSSQYTKPIAGTGDRQTQRLAEAEVTFATVLGARALDLGVEARQEYITSSDGRIAGGSRTLHSVEPFVQLEWTTTRWAVVPGARLTWNEQWGSYLTPRLAVRWAAHPSLTLRASAGRGFRAPDFKELYLDFTNDGAGYAVRGNPDLRPEHSDNITAGAEWATSRLHARALAFWNELHDFIETRPLSETEGFTVYTYGNIEQSRTHGVELETGLTAGALRADAGWSLLDARDDVTGHALLGRPRHSARLALGYAMPIGLRASITGIHTGRTPMQRADDGTVTGEREAYTRVDVRLVQRLPLDLELVIGADNVLNARPALWAESLGRQVYLGLSWRTEGAR